MKEMELKRFANAATSHERYHERHHELYIQMKINSRSSRRMVRPQTPTL